MLGKCNASSIECRKFKTKNVDCYVVKFYYTPLILKNANLINLDFGD